MKKTLIAIGVLVLICASIYTVNNYNKSLSKSPAAIDAKQSTPSVENGTSANNSSSPKQNNSKVPAINNNALGGIKVKDIDFKLKDLYGKEVALSDYKGKKVFLNFWASWCPPCKAEMPEKI